MSIKRFGAGETGVGKQALPFARAVEANGWLYVSGQTAMEGGEIVGGGIVAESRKAIENMIAILNEVEYGVEVVVRVGVCLDDPRDFWTFNDDGRLQSKSIPSPASQNDGDESGGWLCSWHPTGGGEWMKFRWK